MRRRLADQRAIREQRERGVDGAIPSAARKCEELDVLEGPTGDAREERSALDLVSGSGYHWRDLVRVGVRSKSRD